MVNSTTSISLKPRQGVQTKDGKAYLYNENWVPQVREAVEEIEEAAATATTKAGEATICADEASASATSAATSSAAAVSSATTATTKASEASDSATSAATSATEAQATSDAFSAVATEATNTFNSNASSKTTTFNNNATSKTTAFDTNASTKTSDFNDNYTVKKGLIDGQVSVAEAAASTATTKAGEATICADEASASATSAATSSAAAAQSLLDCQEIKDSMVVDATPTENSTNAVSSGGVFASLSFKIKNAATGTNSIIIRPDGTGSITGGQYNAIFGAYAGNDRDGDYNTAFGAFAGTKRGNFTTAVGYNAKAGNDRYNDENYCTAIGTSSIASGNNDLALGALSEATGNAVAIGNSDSVGNKARAFGNGSVAIGFNAKADGSITGNALQFGTGTNNNPNTFQVWDKPLLDNTTGKIFTDRLPVSTAIDSAMKIGQIIKIPCTAYYIPEGCLPCDGTEYTKEQFPGLWDNYLASSPAKLQTCSYTDYESEISTYGQCGKFAIDTTNNKFKVQTIKDGSVIQQAMSDSELGKAYNAGLPNITGNIFADVSVTGGVGALYPGNNPWGGETTGNSNNSLYFDASRSSSVYGNSTTVQPNAITARFFVVVANGSINQSQMDWSAWASGLAGKVGIDLSNITGTGKKVIANLAMASNNYIDLALPASGQFVTATANGYYTISKNASASNQYFGFYNNANGLGVFEESHSYAQLVEMIMPVKQGDVITVNYNLGGVTQRFRFIYAQGEI